MSSILTKIINREIPAYIVSENDFDSSYWTGYNNDTSIQGSPDSWAAKSKDFDDTFKEAVLEWNSEAESSENEVQGKEVLYIKNTAKKFFVF